MLPKSGFPYCWQKQATVEIVEHVPEDDLELYAMRTLPAPESELLEEHLLICSACRDWLESTDERCVRRRRRSGRVEKASRGAVDAVPFVGVLWVYRAVANELREC
jgi:hypothetical protein